MRRIGAVLLGISFACVLLFATACNRTDDTPAQLNVAKEQRPPWKLPLGIMAPMADVKMKNVDGNWVAINDARGEKGTLVMFTCNYCPDVVAWRSRITDLCNDFLEQGGGVILLNPNDPEINEEDSFKHMVNLAKSEKYRFPYVVDATSEMARDFFATTTPEAFLFDGEGRLVYHGTIDDNPNDPSKVVNNYLSDAIKALITGGEIAVKETEPTGCRINFRKPT